MASSASNGTRTNTCASSSTRRRSDAAPTPLISLDDAAALDPARVGRKAATLAALRQHGLPVLPGLIVPVAAGRSAIEHGAAVLGADGAGRARVAVDRLELDAALSSQLKGSAALGDQLVVRSSTALDGDGQWSGAFSSFGEATATDLPTTVRGCWSSVFKPDCIARFEQSGLEPESVGIAVLIQRQLRPDAGGWARVEADGTVRCAGRAGEPAPLLAGIDPGVRGLIGADGAVRGELGALPIDPEALGELAEACRSAASALGVDSFEWAIEEGRPWILQADRTPTRMPAPLAARQNGIPEGAAASAPYGRLAALLIDRRGRLADELVAPWAAARWLPVDLVDAAAPAAGEAPTSRFERIISLADDLCCRSEEATGLSRSELVSKLAEGHSELADVLDHLWIDVATARFVLTGMEEIGRLLTVSRHISSPRSIWMQDPGWVLGALAGNPVPGATERAFDRWGEILWDVVAAVGASYQGVPGSAGRAVGRIATRGPLVGQESDERRPIPGRILALRHPTPDHGAELWAAVGLVTEFGSPAAHLCEIARSLHVPAVVGVGSADTPLDLASCGPDAVIALDGETGSVWVALMADPETAPS